MSGHQAQYAVREPGAVLTRGSERGAATRAGLLDAARAVFTSVGYTEAGGTDIVTAAGASVGSLYHHFTGKADLYLTLFEEFHARLTERTRGAVRRARDARVADPQSLFLAGSRAYLDGCIPERDLSSLFMRGDALPGFELVMRRWQREWTDRNAEFFARGEAPRMRRSRSSSPVPSCWPCPRCRSAGTRPPRGPSPTACWPSLGVLISPAGADRRC